MNEDFKWTDELVRQYLVDNGFASMRMSFEEFKQQKLNSSNKDWEIVEAHCLTSYPAQYKISSVRRLSDGEVFSVGDKVSYGKPCTIIRFFITSNNLMWCDLEYENGNEYHNVNICALDKAKQPLFTTEDGKEIFEGDEYWFTHDDYRVSATKAGSEVRKNAIQKTFSTEEAAKEYVVMNKPCLSVDDVRSWYFHTQGRQDNFDSLKRLVEQKIKHQNGTD
jgi:hypothetical protein